MKKNREWRLADAKKRFSELVNRALAEGPPRVLRRDAAVVVVAGRDYEKLIGTRPVLRISRSAMALAWKGWTLRVIVLRCGKPNGESIAR